MNTVQPKLTTLTSGQIERVHENSLRVLATTGIRVDSERATAIFEKALGPSISGGRVRLPAELVEQALASAPSRVQVFNRSGAVAFRLGGEDNQATHFGIGVTNLWYQDPETDAIQPFSRQHLETAARLGETLESYEVISTPGVLRDISADRAEVVAALEMVANTTKPVIPLVSDIRQFEHVLRLLNHLLGDLSQRPFVVPYFNPVTPLVLNQDITDKLFLTIEAGLPFIYSSYGMSGATAPITAAGTLVMLNAELLAGLVFSQLIRAGTPVILGMLPSLFEMKHMTSAYTPQTMLLNLACAEMMDHYNLPHCGTSGCGTGWGADLSAGETLWMNHLTSCLGKTGLAPFVGGNFDSLVFSPATVVYSHEVILKARLFAEGFSLHDEAVGLSSIDATGPGGNFLMAEQTLALWREAHEEHSHIWPGLSLDKWQAEGSPKASKVLREYVLSVLAHLKTPRDHDELLAKGEAYLRHLKR